MGKKALSILFISMIMVLFALTGCQTVSPVEPIAPAPIPLAEPVPKPLPEPIPEPVPMPELIPEPQPEPVAESIPVQWTTIATEWRGRNGERFTLELPSGGTEGTIWGTGIYTDDSIIGTAAVHAGLVTFAQGGTVTIEIRPGQNAYAGSAQHGITSNSYDDWEGSFVFIDAVGMPVVFDIPVPDIAPTGEPEEVPAFGNFFKVSNYSGYDFFELRIATEEAVARDSATEDLLGVEVLYNLGSFTLDLDNHPELQAAIGQAPEGVLYVYILDEDNDGYLKIWHPQIDPWNIVITTEDLDEPILIPEMPLQPEREEPPYLGDYFLITNNTGYALTEVYIYSVAMMMAGEYGPNLLNGELLYDQESVKVSPKEMSGLAEPIYEATDQSLYLIAVDVDGDQYATDWDPDVESWNILIDFEHIVAVEPEEPTYLGDFFQITNNTGYDLHYLDIYSDAMLEESKEGFNLLGDEILYDGGFFRIYPHEYTDLAKAIYEDEGEVLHIEMFDEDDDYYYRDWVPDEESWDVEITIGDFVDTEQLHAEVYGDFFQVINDTGYEIWYLFLVTEEMLEAQEVGEDLLPAWLLFDGESVAIYPDEFPGLKELLYAKSGETFYLIAYDEDDYRYMKEWTPDTDSWDIVVSGEDFVDFPTKQED